MPLLAALMVGCEGSPTQVEDGLTYSFSFEEGLDGWAPRGLDLGDPPVDWEIARSAELSSVGEWSVKFRLDNLTDAGKIWLEHSFEVSPGTTYDVELTYSFASRGFGQVNLWTIIAGALPEAPTEVEDLPFRGDTGNGQDEDVGWVWMDKEYRDWVTTGSEGLIHVVVGVWGTWEGLRTYYVDRIGVRLTPTGL